MDALSRIFLHVTFCSAMLHAPAGTPVAMHVVFLHHNGVAGFDQTFRIQPEGKDGVVEFDVAPGVYRMQIDVPKYACSRVDFINVLDGLNRNLNETLADAPPPPQANIALFDGAAAPAFIYLKPTFLIFDGTQACNQPIGTPIPVQTETEYDQGSYHLWMHADSALIARAPLVAALRLQTTTGTAHYVRVKIPFPVPWSGWPNVYEMNVTEDMVDGLATEKIDTLLCPKVWTVRSPG